MLNRYFDTGRFYYLLKNELFSKCKSWLIYSVTVIGFYLLVSMITGLLNKNLNITFDSDALNRTFLAFLFIGGYISSSLTFSDSNNKLKSSIWLTIPGSSIEKYLIGLLVSGAGYALFLTFLYWISSLLSILITKPLFSLSNTVFNPFSIDLGHGILSLSVFRMTLIYILTQPIFIVGSIYFKLASFVKTVFSLVLINIGYYIVFTIIINITNSIGLLDRTDINIFLDFTRRPVEELKEIVSTAFLIWGIIVNLFFNILGYSLLIEKEVKDGI